MSFKGQPEDLEKQHNKSYVSGGNNSHLYTGTFNFFTLCVIVTGAATGLLLGYDNGVMGGVQSMEEFQKKFFYNSTYQHNFVSSEEDESPYCKYNDQVYQLLISSLYLAGAFGAVGAEFIAHKAGRKPTMLFAGLATMAGAAILASAPSIGPLFVGRSVMGLGVGAGTMVGPVYLSECSPAKMRGALGVIFQLFVTIGILVSGLINYGSEFIHPWGWRLPLALAGAPGAFIVLAGLVLPESPNSLAERNKFQESIKVLRKLRGVQNVEVEFSDIVYAARQSQLIRNPYWNLISKKKYRPQLVISCVFMICQQFDGINAIVFYAPQLFSSLASGALGSLLNTVIVNAVNVAATIPSIVLVDKVGRRKVLFFSTVWMLVTQIIVAVVLKEEFGKYGSDLPTAPSVGILVMICVYICGHAFGWGPIGWIYPVEIQPLETRAAGSGINTASNMLFTFVIGQSFTTMLCSMEYGVFLFFAGCLVLMGIFAHFLLPETKHIPVEKVHAVFKEHAIWTKLHPEVREVQAEDLGPTADMPAAAVEAGAIRS